MRDDIDLAVRSLGALGKKGANALAMDDQPGRLTMKQIGHGKRHDRALRVAGMAKGIVDGDQHRPAPDQARHQAEPSHAIAKKMHNIRISRPDLLAEAIHEAEIARASMTRPRQQNGLNGRIDEVDMILHLALCGKKRHLAKRVDCIDIIDAIVDWKGLNAGYLHSCFTDPSQQKKRTVLN